MADFALRIVAAESGLGWESGTFMPIYEANQRGIIETSLEGNPVAQAIRQVITHENYPDGWKGTASGLLYLLNQKAEGVFKGRFWTQSPTAMGSALRRIPAPLSRVGYIIERSRGVKRMIAITPLPPTG